MTKHSGRMIPDSTADALIEAALAYGRDPALATSNAVRAAADAYREAHEELPYASDPLEDLEAGFWSNPMTVRHLAARIDKLVARVQKLEM